MTHEGLAAPTQNVVRPSSAPALIPAAVGFVLVRHRTSGA